MFCKKYIVRESWNIGVGAVLNVYHAHPFLLQICKELYAENPDWFIGDIDALVMYEPQR